MKDGGKGKNILVRRPRNGPSLSTYLSPLGLGMRVAQLAMLFRFVPYA